MCRKYKNSYITLEFTSLMTRVWNRVLQDAGRRTFMGGLILTSAGFLLLTGKRAKVRLGVYVCGL